MDREHQSNESTPNVIEKPEIDIVNKILFFQRNKGLKTLLFPNMKIIGMLLLAQATLAKLFTC